MGKAKGLSSRGLGHKKALCSRPPGLTRLALWESEACPGSQRTQERQRREFLCGQSLVPGGNRMRSLVIFRALSGLAAAHHTGASTMATWRGSQMGSILGKGGQGTTELGFA